MGRVPEGWVSLRVRIAEDGTNWGTEELLHGVSLRNSVYRVLMNGKWLILERGLGNASIFLIIQSCQTLSTIDCSLNKPRVSHAATTKLQDYSRTDDEIVIALVNRTLYMTRRFENLVLSLWGNNWATDLDPRGKTIPRKLPLHRMNKWLQFELNIVEAQKIASSGW